ncbi:hypothetical protein WDZ17_16355, partial [Pseudokineococcus basanitobsidens]
MNTEKHVRADAERTEASRQFWSKVIIAALSGTVLFLVIRIQDAADEATIGNAWRTWQILTDANEAHPPTLDSSQVLTVISTLLVYCGAAALALVSLEHAYRDEISGPLTTQMADRLAVSATLASAVAISVALGHAIAGDPTVPRSHRYMMIALALLTVYAAAAVGRSELEVEVSARRDEINRRVHRYASVTLLWKRLNKATRNPSRLSWRLWLATGAFALVPVVALIVSRGALEAQALSVLLLFYFSMVMLSAGSDLILASLSIAHLLKERGSVATLSLLMAIIFAVVVSVGYYGLFVLAVGVMPV